MTTTCEVCGGETRTGARYIARCRDGTLVNLPSIECTSCGAIRPDGQRIRSLPPEAVPPSVRAAHQLPMPGHKGDTLKLPRSR
jgi:hypothetical protein